MQCGPRSSSRKPTLGATQAPKHLQSRTASPFTQVKVVNPIAGPLKLVRLLLHPNKPPSTRSEKRRTHSRARRPGASFEECHKPLPRRYRSWLSQKWERPVGTSSNGSPPKERSPTLVCGWTGPVASHSDSNNDFSFAGTGQSSSERFIILAPQNSANARNSAAETLRTGIQLTVTAQIGVSTRPKASANRAKYLWWDAVVFWGRAVILPTQCQSYLNWSNPSIRLLTL